MSKIAHSNAASAVVIGAEGNSNSSFRLDRTNAKLAGVCGGLANTLDVDAFWIRLGFAAGTIMGFGSLVLIYIAIALFAD